MVRFIASNKTARLMVTFYSVLLHGLIFVVLYKMAMTESCKHDMAAKWHEKYIEHMQVSRRKPYCQDVRLKPCQAFQLSLFSCSV